MNRLANNRASLGVRNLFNPRFKILAYHAVVTNNPGPYEVTSNTFRNHMQILRDWNYSVVPLSTALSALNQGSFPNKMIVITFDDGDISILENAIPILKEHKFSATIFVPTGFVGKSDVFSGHTTERQILDWFQLITLINAGFEVGSHSVYHQNLTRLETKELKHEVFQSHRSLVKHLGNREYYFAYPYGMFNKAVRDLLAVSPFAGAMCFGSVLSNWKLTDRYQLKREKVLSTTGLKEFRQLINPVFDFKRAVTAFTIKHIKLLFNNAAHNGIQSFSKKG